MAWPKNDEEVYAKVTTYANKKFTFYNKEPSTREKDNELHDVLHSSFVNLTILFAVNGSSFFGESTFCQCKIYQAVRL